MPCAVIGLTMDLDKVTYATQGVNSLLKAHYFYFGP